MKPPPHTHPFLKADTTVLFSHWDGRRYAPSAHVRGVGGTYFFFFFCKQTEGFKGALRLFHTHTVQFTYLRDYRSARGGLL